MKNLVECGAVSHRRVFCWVSRVALEVVEHFYGIFDAVVVIVFFAIYAVEMLASFQEFDDVFVGPVISFEICGFSSFSFAHILNRLGFYNLARWNGFEDLDFECYFFEDCAW